MHINKSIIQIALVSAILCWLDDYDVGIIFLFFAQIAYLYKNVDKHICLGMTMSTLATLQWLVGAVVYYSSLNPGMITQNTIMLLSKQDYFSFAYPGTLLFFIGLNLFKPNYVVFEDARINILNGICDLKKFPIAILIISFILDFIALGLPFSIGQIVKFVALLKFFGLSMLILRYYVSRNKSDLFIVVICIVLLAIQSLNYLMFGDFVFVLLTTSIVLAPLLSINPKIKLVGLSSAIILIMSIQLIKYPARIYKLKNPNSSNSEVISKALNNNLDKSLYKDIFIRASLARFNQASVITWVMNYVPRELPYEKGKTVLNALAGSFIPRFIWTSKPIVGQAMYEKYTGLDLDGASYGISQLGESYLNFGKFWGITFMLILGLTFNFIQNSCIKRSKKYYLLILILPIFFLHGIKVETDINRSLGFIIRLIVIYGLLNYLRTSLGFQNLFGYSEISKK